MKKILSCLLMVTLSVLMVVSCATVPKDLVAAGDYLYNLYKDNDVATASDYKVVSVVNIAGVTYPVQWTLNVTAGPADGVKLSEVDSSKMITVDVNERTEEDIAYTLTATLFDAKKGKKSTTVAFEHTVPKFKINTWSEYVAAAKDDVVVVKGIVTVVIAKSLGNSYNCLYLQDADGGYYAYSMADDPAAAGIKPGMTVLVTGVRDTYSGTYEIASGVVEIVDANTSIPAAADYTALFNAATSIKDAALVEKQGFLVTVKDVVITGEDTSKGYYKFKGANGLESYVRISSSVCPLSKDDQATFKVAHAEHMGWVADVTGVICLYDGAFYLTPIDSNAIVYKSIVKKSDAEMVEFEIANLTITDMIIAEDSEIVLPLYGKAYDDVNFFWFFDGAAVYGDTISVTMPEETKFTTLKCIVMCGGVMETLEFDVELRVLSMTDSEKVVAAYALADGEFMVGTQTITGVITKIGTAYSEQYGNITVTIVVPGLEDKPIDCFRMTGEGAGALAVGDTITVTGSVKNYKGTIEFDKGCTFTK